MTQQEELTAIEYRAAKAAEDGDVKAMSDICTHDVPVLVRGIREAWDLLKQLGRNHVAC